MFLTSCQVILLHREGRRNSRPGLRPPGVPPERTLEGRPGATLGVAGTNVEGPRGPEGWDRESPTISLPWVWQVQLTLSPSNANDKGRATMNDMNLNLILKLGNHVVCQGDTVPERGDADRSPVPKKSLFAFSTLPVLEIKNNEGRESTSQNMNMICNCRV